MIEWTRTQADAIEAVHNWYKAGTQPIFRLFGYAGTGKTTLAKYLAEQIGGYTLFAAYTGKAASVLRANGCPEATTLHSLMYQPKDKSRQRLRELQEDQGKTKNPSAERDRLEEEIIEEKKRLKQPAFSLNPDSEIPHADLLVIDEVSMVNKQMGKDILSFGVPVLVLGDPGQLPPPFGGGYFTAEKPDIMLTEIHRQARGNPIIDIATKARRGEPIPLGDYGAVQVIKRDDLKKEMVMEYDQALCWRNATRRSVNAKFRELYGLPAPFPVKGDRLVCLRNNHKKGLLNGTIWNVIETPREHEDKILAWIENEEGAVQHVEMHKQIFLGEEVPPWEARNGESFDFGYCLTVHKSQGSQWKSVLLFDESPAMRNGTEKRGWRYTGITRASEKLLIVR